MVKQYFHEHNLKDKIDFRGQLCTGNCAHGPILKIDDTTYSEVSTYNIINILDTFFSKQS